MRKPHTKYKAQNTRYKHSRFARRKAFTLLELLIVIGISTVLSGVGITYYAAQRRVKVLEAATQEIVGYLRYAQHKSIAQEEGKQWGVHFENPSSGSDFYALYSDSTYSSPVETRYLPAGVEFQSPSPGNSTDISFDKLTGTFSGTYKQIILKNTQGKTSNILVCSQGIIEKNSDVSICGLVNTTPPVIGAVIPENTSYGSFVDSPFDLTASISEPEGGVISCEYTTDGGTNWLPADLTGTGPDYTCTKTGITSPDGTALSLNIRATSSGGTGIGTAVSRTVDAAPPTCSDNWTDDWTSASPVNITLSSSDGTGSGVANTKYCVDTTNTCTPSTSGTSVSVTCASGATCVQYVRYSATDNVGNTSPVYSKRVRQDLQKPSDGTLTATAGVQEIDLSWSGFSDAGSGLATSNTYKLVYSTSTTPIDCNSGTQVYLGTATSYSHTGLTDSATYYYRVCAFDALGHMSSGATAQAPEYYCDEDGDGHYTGTLVDCPSGGTSATAGDDCNDSCATCYPGSTAYTTSPDGLDQDCDGTVDEITYTACTPSYGDATAWGYNSNCEWLEGGYYSSYREGGSNNAPADNTHCTVSGNTCTSYDGGWGNCSEQHAGWLENTNGYIDCAGNTWYHQEAGGCHACDETFEYTCSPMTGCTTTHHYQ